MQDTEFDTILRTADPDRRLAALFAPDEIRARLFALYAFNHEVARIAEATSEGMIAEMKLTWWREAVADIHAPQPRIRRHAVTEGLAAIADRVSQAELDGLLDARFDDIAGHPFATLDDVFAYVDATAGQLMRLALRLCDAGADDDLVLTAGRAWGLTGLLRAFPVRAQIGRAPVGGEDLARVGATPAMLAQGLGRAKVAEALGPVRDAAADAVARLKTMGPLPAEAVPALGYARLAGAYLDALPDNPYALAAERPLIMRQARLTWLALTGR